MNNLDLTYIHSKIIVIGSPYHNDTVRDLQNYLNNTFTRSNYLIYNFSSEEEYNIEQDLQNVITYGFPENTPCPLDLLIHICNLIHIFLLKNEENVIVLHSKNGKNRSCMIASCILLLLAYVSNMEEAIKIVKEKRGKIEDDTLIIPSQLRYCYYYEKLLKTEQVYNNTFQLLMLRFNTIPKFNSSIVNCGCSPFFTIHVLASSSDNTVMKREKDENNEMHNINPSVYQYHQQYISKKIYESFNPLQPPVSSPSRLSSASSSLYEYRSHYDKFVEYDLSEASSSSSSSTVKGKGNRNPRNTDTLAEHDERKEGKAISGVLVRGDFYITFYHYSAQTSKYEKMFQVFLHTGFIDKPGSSCSSISASDPSSSNASVVNHNLYYVSFAKLLIDNASLDKEHCLFDKEFSFELLFQQKENKESINQVNDDEYYAMLDGNHHSQSHVEERRESGLGSGNTVNFNLPSQRPQQSLKSSYRTSSNVTRTAPVPNTTPKRVNATGQTNVNAYYTSEFDDPMKTVFQN
jgi:protein-tyrosine phosphatase